MKTRNPVGTAAVMGLALLLVGCGKGEHEENAPRGGHKEQAGEAGHEGHAGEAGHEGEEEGGDHVALSPEAAAEAKLEIGSPGPGKIEISLELPGEVIADPDQVAHITPKAAGTAREVKAVLGSRVRAGEVLAVIESPELGEAKIGYLEALRARDLASFDHDRQSTVSGNTKTMLGVLAKEPSPEAAREETAGLAIGEDKGRLLTAYSNHRLAKRNRDREEDLFRRKINSEAELLTARNAFDAAAAEYASVRESVEFAHVARLLDAQRALRAAEANLQNRERRLHLLGVAESEVEGLGKEPDDRIAWYSLRSPIEGIVVEKHCVLGESVDTSTRVFVVTDLSRVQVRFQVPPADLPRVRPGQKVRVRVDGLEASGEGRVDYLSPVAEERTRMAEGRVFLPNPDGKWRPGLFGAVRIVLEEAEAKAALPAEAVFRHEGREVVFVEEEERKYEPRPVRIGRRDPATVEVLEGVKPGDKVVVKNAFVLKAELGKEAGGHDH